MGLFPSGNENKDGDDYDTVGLVDTGMHIPADVYVVMGVCVNDGVSKDNDNGTNGDEDEVDSKTDGDGGCDAENSACGRMDAGMPDVGSG